MDKVRVYVVAGPNKGKTTIAHVIKSALEEHDFKKVTLQDTKASVTENKQPIEQRVQATKERPVSIEVVSVSSDPSAANSVPSIVARGWIKTLKDIRVLAADEIALSDSKLRELDNIIEELQTLTR